ncbi:MAG: hypothetical protein FJZ57_00910 [Chlamydiae bacterium]|nr:hypothetical protein [Chlamydiota bacterium]
MTIGSFFIKTVNSLKSIENRTSYSNLKTEDIDYLKRYTDFLRQHPVSYFLEEEVRGISRELDILYPTIEKSQQKNIIKNISKVFQRAIVISELHRYYEINRTHSVCDYILFCLQHAIPHYDPFTKEFIQEYLSYQEIRDVSMEMYPLVEGLTNPSERMAIIKLILSCSSERKEAICFLSQNLIKDIWEGSKRIKIIQAVIDIPDSMREEVVYYTESMCGSVTICAEEKVKVIHLIQNVPSYLREEVVTVSHALTQKTWSGKGKASVLITVRKLIEQSKKDVIALATALCMDTLTNYDVNTVLVCIDSLPEHERIEICDCAYMLCRNLTDGDERREVILGIASLKPADRIGVSSICVKICNFYKEFYNRSELIRIVGKIPEKQRESLVRQLFTICFNKINFQSVCVVLKELAEYPVSERDFVCDLIKSLQHDSLDLSYLGVYLMVFRYFDPRDRGEALVALKKVLRSKVHFSGHLSLVTEILNLSPRLISRTHEHMKSLVTSITDLQKASRFANDLYHQREDLKIFEDSELGQVLVSTIITTSDEGAIKNPYRIFQNLLCFSSQKNLRSPPVQILGRNRSKWDVEGMRKRGGSITLSLDQAHLTFGRLWRSKDLVELVSEIETRYNFLCGTSKKEIMDCVEQVCGSPIDELCSNIKDPFFLRLLDEVTGNDLPLVNAYFMSILSFIFDQSNEIDAAPLSDRELTFLKISASIRNCSVGKSESIVLVYNQLEDRYKFITSEEKAELPLVVVLKLKIWNLVQDRMNILMSSQSDMMKEMTGETQQIQQLPHQSLYVKNILSSHIGFHHDLKFDPHTYMLYEGLIEKNLEELLDIFYKHFLIKDLILDLQKLSRVSIVSTNPETRKIFNGICQILDKQDPESNQKYWLFDERLLMPISLSTIGALKILEECSIITSLNNE